MLEITLVSVVFLITMAVVVLRFTTVVNHILDSSIQDRANRARELDEAHRQAFSAAMTALESINQRVTDTQTDLLARTLDSVAGPQGETGGPYATDRPQMDNRPPWRPDDEYDYTGIGLDPTDDLLPDPPLEPDDNAARAVMVPPGQSLLPRRDS
jgi:hypothetical protein